MEAIRTADSHWLLHLLKETDVEQEDLDRAVHAAAWSGHPDIVRMLLSAGAGLYSVNQHGQPLLVEAVYSANAQVVRAILQVTIARQNHNHNVQAQPTLYPRERKYGRYSEIRTVHCDWCNYDFIW